MKIVICPVCEKKIHHASKCMFCGNESGFQEIGSPVQIHDNAQRAYSRLDTLLENRHFEELCRELDIVLKWMPTNSEVFWMRILAKRNCSCDQELVQEGISLMDSVDYYNALRFASSDERETYNAVQIMLEKLKEKYMDAVKADESSAKKSIHISDVQDEFAEKIRQHSIDLKKLWEELEMIEHELHVLENNLNVAVIEYEKDMRAAKDDADVLLQRIEGHSGCTLEEAHSYEIQLGHDLSISEQALYGIDVFKREHSWSKEYLELKDKRNYICEQISSQIADMDLYKSKIEAILAWVADMEIMYKSAIDAVSGYDFTGMRALLGREQCMAAMKNAGLAISENV